MSTQLDRHAFLLDLLTQPTAPFREKHVISRVLKELKQGSVPHFQDPIGNIVVGAASATEYRKLLQASTAQDPIRIFIAHMDHPGFHGEKWLSPDLLEVKWHGGTPTEHLSGASVWISDPSGSVGSGKVESATLTSSGKSIQSAQIRVLTPQTAKIRVEKLFGGFQFRKPVWQDGDLLYTKAADDLIGAFAIVSVALDLWKTRKKRPPFLGLLTRAEEVGFIGAIGHFELGWLKPSHSALCVSLETSRTLPGAEIGKGPVVRLGDRLTVFDSGALRVFSDLAQEILPGLHQKRIMDGGACEATAATVYGHRCVGISVPLGNYHNQSLEGGPDASPPHGPAPEFVHIQDIAGLIQLCHGLLIPKLPWKKPWQKRQTEFQKELKGYRKLLQAGLL